MTSLNGMKAGIWGAICAAVLIPALARAQASPAGGPPAPAAGAMPARTPPPPDNPFPAAAKHPALFLVGDSIMRTGTGDGDGDKVELLSARCGLEVHAAPEFVVSGDGSHIYSHGQWKQEKVAMSTLSVLDRQMVQ